MSVKKITVKRLEWSELKDSQRHRIRKKVARHASEVQAKHNYMKRLKRSRTTSDAPYVLLPKSVIKPKNGFWVVWRRLGTEAVVTRRTLVHKVTWELYGPRENGVRSVLKAPFPVNVTCTQDRKVWEDFAASLSVGHRLGN